MSTTIGIIGAMDTKGAEFQFAAELLKNMGHKVLLINTGVIGEPAMAPDISAETVARAGGRELSELREKRDRGEAMQVMAAGAAKVARQLYEEGKIDGLFGMGGTAGTAVASSAMRTLPVGFPKLIVTTVAAGDTRGYLGTKDILLYPAIVDVAGVNRISREVFTRAAGAMSGMVKASVVRAEDKPLIAASMFGNTTECVERARKKLEAENYEVVVFHCTGTGGKTMESLVADGYFDAVLDITTTEWADEIAGGVFAAGPERGDAAGKRGIPQVIVPGCVDMVNFWAMDTVPERYRNRNLYAWNPNITLMRTTPEENEAIGKKLAEKANQAKGPVAFLLPLKGVSILDSPGQPFWDPEADKRCFETIKRHLRPDIPVYEMDCNINDPAFADRAAELLLAMLKEKNAAVKES